MLNKPKHIIFMTITLIKETHPETGRVRYSVERNGIFVDGSLTEHEDVARRIYNALKKSTGISVWEREVVENEER